MTAILCCKSGPLLGELCCPRANDPYHQPHLYSRSRRGLFKGLMHQPQDVFWRPSEPLRMMMGTDHRLSVDHAICRLVLYQLTTDPRQVRRPCEYSGRCIQGCIEVCEVREAGFRQRW